MGGYMYKFSEPKQDGDLRHSGDCMIRAVVHATGVPYRTVHKIMYGHGWRATGGDKGIWSEHILQTLADLGYGVEKISFPPQRGKRRVNGNTICKRYPRGTYIINQWEHVSCIKNGKLLDTGDCSEDFVYYMWRVFKAPLK